MSGVHEGRDTEGGFFRWTGALYANFQKPTKYTATDDGCIPPVCFTKRAPGDVDDSLPDGYHSWAPNSGLLTFPSSMAVVDWWPDWAMNAWLNYQWTCYLGPDFAKDMGISDIQAWQRASPIYCVADAKTLTETVDNPADIDIVSVSGWQTFWHGKSDMHKKPFFSMTMYSIYVSAMLNLDDLWPGRAADWWHLMYANYSTPYGALSIESWINVMDSKNDPVPIDVQRILRSNYLPSVQKRYCILNEPDFSSPAIVATGYGDYGGTIGYSPRLTGDLFKTVADSRPRTRWGFPLWTPDERKTAFMTILPHIASLGDDGKWATNYANVEQYLQIYIDNGWLTANPQPKPPSTCPSGMSVIGDGSACQSDSDAKQFCSLWGTEYSPCYPPVYDPTKHPVKITEPKSGKGGVSSGINVPGFSGDLPLAPESALRGQTPWAPPATDPNHAGYDVPCGERPETQKIIIVAGTIIGSLVPLLILPGKSKVAGAVTLGSFAYSFLSESLGWNAFVSGSDTPASSTEVDAALILSIGAPITGVLLAYDLGLQTVIPTSFNNEPALAAASGAAGYLALDPLLQPFVGVAGSLVTAATALPGFLDGILSGFKNGCYEHTLAPGCKCEDSQSKKLLAKQLIDIYGTTGDQASMRIQCLNAAMKEGDWGKDPVTIGSCGDKGIMSNPAACIIPEWWTPDNMDPKDQLVSGMFSKISPCLDPSNRSFLPPGYTFDVTTKLATHDSALAARDNACISANGQYSRYVNGTCVDTSKISTVRGSVV